MKGRDEMDFSEQMYQARIDAMEWKEAERRRIEAEEEFEDDDRYMGSDSDFSDHALGIDY